MVSSEFIEGIGLIAGLLGVIAWIPQLQKVWIQKLHEGISIPTILIICIALVLWTVYGILVDSFAIIDDLIATGGTAECVSKILDANHKIITGLLVVVELQELGGSSRFNYPVESILKY